VDVGDYKGHAGVSFANGDPRNPVLTFAGGRIGGDGLLFFSDAVNLGSSPDIHLNRIRMANRETLYNTWFLELTPYSG
jgi:hypothetical protein